MCQNHKNRSISRLKGSIILTPARVPVFMAGAWLKPNNHGVLAKGVSFYAFQRFCRYCGRHGLFTENANTVLCDFATLKALFEEFIEIEHNLSLTAVLFRNNILYPAPEVKALSSPCGTSTLNFWLKKARRLLRSAMGAGFFFSRGPRQMTK